MQNRVEQLSNMRYEVAKRRTRLFPGKHSMTDLMTGLKEAEIKEEAIPEHMSWGRQKHNI